MRRPLAFVLALALVAGACASEESSSEDTTSTSEATTTMSTSTTTTTTLAPVDSGETDAEPPPGELEPLTAEVTRGLGRIGPETWMFEVGLDGEGRAGVAFQTLENEGSNRFSLARCEDRGCSDIVTTDITIEADMAYLEAVAASASGALVVYLPVSSHNAGLVGTVAVTCIDVSCSEWESSAFEALVFDATAGTTGVMVAAYGVPAGPMGVFACGDPACRSGMATAVSSLHGPSVSGFELLPDGRPVMFYGGAAEEGEPGNLVAVCDDDVCSSATVIDLSAVGSAELGDLMADYPMHAVSVGSDSVVFGCLDAACEAWGRSEVEDRSIVRWTRLITDDAGTVRPVYVVTDSQVASLVVCDDLQCTQPSELTLGLDEFQFARVAMDETGALFVVCRDKNDLMLHACPSPFDCGR